MEAAENELDHRVVFQGHTRRDQALYPCGHDRWGAVVHISKLGPPAQRRVGSFLDDAHGQNGTTQLDDECLPDRQRRQRIGLSVQHCWLQLEQPPLCLLGLGKGLEMPSQQLSCGVLRSRLKAGSMDLPPSTWRSAGTCPTTTGNSRFKPKTFSTHGGGRTPQKPRPSRKTFGANERAETFT